MHLESNEHSLGHLTAGLRAINTTIEDATLRASQGINRVAARARSTGGVSAQQLLKAVKRAVKDEVRFMITLILGIIRVEEDISQGPSRIDAIVKALRGLTDEQFKRLLLSRSLDGLATEPTMQAPTADTQSGKHHNVGTALS